MKRLSLTKKKRLTANRQFEEILANRLCAADKLLKLFIAKNGYSYCRLGVSVSKAYGNAVQRNRIKRLFREAFRQNQDRIPVGFDYLLMPSDKLAGKPDETKKGGIHSRKNAFKEVEESFLTLVKSVTKKGN